MVYGNQNQVNGAIPIATTYNPTISSSTTVTFNAKTKQIQVTAINQTILMKWGATASTSAFDAVISVGYPTTFTIPINPTTGLLYTTAQFIQSTTTAILVVCEF
jgi:hypothetical protein